MLLAENVHELGRPCEEVLGTCMEIAIYFDVLTDTRRTQGGHTADTSTAPSTAPVKIRNKRMRASKNL